MTQIQHGAVDIVWCNKTRKEKRREKRKRMDKTQCLKRKNQRHPCLQTAQVTIFEISQRMSLNVLGLMS